MNENLFIDLLNKLNKKNDIDEWLHSKYKIKPLIIYGNSGLFKSSLSNYILRNLSKVIIDIEFCKSNHSFIDFINLTLYKFSIKMMYENNKFNHKSLIVDDLNHIMKNDKKLFKSFIKWFHSLKTYKNPMIFICNSINHQQIRKIYDKCYPIHISFNENDCYYYTKNYFINHKIINDNEIKLLIQKSNYNFNNIKINIDFYKDKYNRIQYYDIDYYDSLEKIKYLLKKNNIINYINYHNNDTIGLNILENCSSLTNDIFIIDKIYDNILLSDYINSILSYNNENIFSILVIFQITIPILLLKNNYNKENLNTIIFNKYISKSIIYTHNNTLLNTLNTLNTLNYKLIENIFSLFEEYLQENNSQKKKYIKKNLNSFCMKYNISQNEKIIMKYINYYSYFYKNTKINKKNIYILFEE